MYQIAAYNHASTVVRLIMDQFEVFGYAAKYGKHKNLVLPQSGDVSELDPKNLK